MTPVETMPRQGRPRPRSRLRLIAGQQRRTPAPAAGGAVVGGAVAGGGISAGNVLVAGADASGRRRMVDEMRGLLPEGASFVEAGETWQVLALAGHSSMVIVTGELGDVSAPGLVKVLARRHPLLPVVALRGEGRRVAASGDAGAASL